jgi:hypothetical protein
MARPGAVAVALHGAPSTRSRPARGATATFRARPCQDAFRTMRRITRQPRRHGRARGRCIPPPQRLEETPASHEHAASVPSNGRRRHFLAHLAGGRPSSVRSRQSDISATPFIFTRTPTSSPQYRADIAERACEVISAPTGGLAETCSDKAGANLSSRSPSVPADRFPSWIL